MARLASSTHWAEATIVADGGCSRGRMVTGAPAEGEPCGAGAAVGPPDCPPTLGGTVGAAGGCWTGGVAHPQLSRSGRRQSTPRANAPNLSRCGLFPFPAIMATPPPDA